MKKNLILGILISAVLLYFSLREINLVAVMDSFRAMKSGYLIPVTALLVLLQVLRSYRWGIILEPIKKLDQLSLFC